MTTTRSNEAAIAAFLQSFEPGKREERRDLLANDIVVSDWMMPGIGLRGEEEVIEKFYAPIRVAFPDVYFELHDAIIGDDKVVIRGEFTGTFERDYTYPVGERRVHFPAHGGRVHWKAHDIYQFKGGKIARIWFANDTLTVARQLGALPDDGKPW